MKEGWIYKKLGEVCDTINGLWKGKKPPFVNIGVIRNANFTKDFTLRFDNVEYLDVEERQYVKRKLQKGDLIIEKSGGSEKQPVGRAVLFDKEDGDFSFSNFTSVLRIKDKNELLSEFLFIYLLYVYRRGDTLKMQKATTGIHNIEFDKYLNIDIPDIPLSEQHSIVARLDAAFAGIDALKANAERQLAEARAHFNRALTEEMTPKEGWENKNLVNLCKIINGYAFPSTAFGDQGEVKSIKITNVGVGVFIDDERNNLPQEYLNTAKDAIVYESDIVVALTRTVISDGLKVAIVPESYNGSLLNQRVAALRAFPKEVVNTFLYYYFKTQDAKKYVLKKVNTLMQPNLSIVDLRNMPVPCPTLAVQLSIVARLDALSANVRRLEEVQRKTLAECDALKQAMLREVFE